MRSLDIVNECNGAYSANAAAVIRNVAWMLYRRKDYFGAVVQKLKEVALHEKDTGSSEAQIALLTDKIENLEVTMILIFIFHMTFL